MASLPYADVDSNLRDLAGKAEGFGRLAVGGLHGPIYSVTTLADDGPGSLREGCRRQEPLWIVFEISGTINLSSYLSVSSYKTIDGRGQRIKFTGKGLRLKECEHIIICNLEFEGGRGHDVDGIQIKPNSRHIWIDRCSLHDYDDGLIDITRQSTDITVSRCYFSQHDKTMLIGADPSHIGDRCIRIYSQNNIYEAGEKKVAFKYYTEMAADMEEAKSGLIRSEGDLFLNGVQSCLLTGIGEECIFHPSEYYPTWTMEMASDSLKSVLQVCTGWQAIPRPAELMTSA
ncbi:putative pectate lyase 4 [Vitis vinifera]|uniref:Pectate lyase n=1 Tax=Vitis vinifera TaxID=29760 RepID=A0A438ENU0_VITVI|nr:putative pectate lyase 4 [Vitis vinifera]